MWTEQAQRWAVFQLNSFFLKNNNDLISFEYFFNLYFDGQKKIRRNL